MIACLRRWFLARRAFANTPPGSKVEIRTFRRPRRWLGVRS
jgi:hypothetical protein